MRDQAEDSMTKLLDTFYSPQDPPGRPVQPLEFIYANSSARFSEMLDPAEKSIYRKRDLQRYQRHAGLEGMKSQKE